MHLALYWIDENCLPEESTAIVTDSKLLCDTLHGYGLNTKMLQRRLVTSCAKVEVQWALSRSDVEGNEIADTATKAATLLDKNPTEISYVCASSLIKRSINDEQPPKVWGSLLQIFFKESRNQFSEGPGHTG